MNDTMPAATAPAAASIVTSKPRRRHSSHSAITIGASSGSALILEAIASPKATPTKTPKPHARHTLLSVSPDPALAPTGLWLSLPIVMGRDGRLVVS